MEHIFFKKTYWKWLMGVWGYYYYHYYYCYCCCCYYLVMALSDFLFWLMTNFLKIKGSRVNEDQNLKLVCCRCLSVLCNGISSSFFLFLRQKFSKCGWNVRCIWWSPVFIWINDINSCREWYMRYIYPSGPHSRIYIKFCCSS